MTMAGVFPSLALAQAGQPADLPAVTVTATTSPRPLPEAYAGGQVARGSRLGILGNQDMMDVPFSIMSYTAETIQNQQARTVADVLANDPGIRTSHGYGNFAETFLVRGFKLYGDDVGYNGLYGIAPRQLVAVEGIERVEVFRGPNAFLGGISPGASGIGGGINLVPKYAPAAALTQATLDYGSDSQVGGHVDIGRRFGPGNRAGIRLNALARGGDTGIDRENRNERLFTVGLDYQGTAFRIHGDFGYQKQTVRGGRSTVHLAGGVVPPVPGPTVNFAQPWSKSALEDTYGTVRAEYDFVRNWTGYVAAGAHHANEQGDFSSVAVDGTGRGSGIFRTFQGGYRMTVPYKQDTTSQEAGVRGTFRTGPVGHQVNVAWSALQSRTRTAYEMSGYYATNLYDAPAVPYPAKLFSGGNMARPGVTDRLNLISYALSDNLSFFQDRVLLTAGVRYQILSDRPYTYDGKHKASYSKSATSPAFGLVVKPLANVSVYYNHMEGLTKGPTAPVDSDRNGEVFPPGRSKQNEAGVKWDAGKVGTTLAIFQINQPNGVTQNKVFYMTDQRNRGVELSAFGEPLRGVRVMAGAAWIGTRVSNTGNPATEGRQAVGVPGYTFNASVEWDLPWVGGATVSGRFLQTGSQYVNDTNTAKLAAWNRLDLGARYTFKAARQRYTVRAAVENVANKAYWASGFGGYLVQGAPRTFKVAMTVDF